jgi:hypothetical protein
MKIALVVGAPVKKAHYQEVVGSTTTYGTFFKILF